MAATLTIEKGSSLGRDAWLRLRKNWLSMFGLFIIIAILLMCFVLPFFLGDSYQPNKGDLNNTFAPPSADHWLGTDQLGRDLFHRILNGGQLSLIIAIGATALTLFIGVVYGCIAGFYGGRIDSTMMRIVDGLLAMPFLIVVVLFRELVKTPINDGAAWTTATLKLGVEGIDNLTRVASMMPLLIAIAAFGWLSMARIVRSAAAELRHAEFVDAGRSLGLSNFRILFRHILPNILSPIIIYATLTIPSFILYEATLSFIGLGIEPPSASWGVLIKEGVNFLEAQPSLLLIPGVFFSLTLFAFNFLGDGLRDALDVKSSKD